MSALIKLLVREATERVTPPVEGSKPSAAYASKWGYHAFETCPSCKGRKTNVVPTRGGLDRSEMPCATCNGEGEVRKSKTIESMSMSKRILTEMALDLGDAPDWIDPQKKAKISGGTHPYANNPAFPQQKPARRPGAPFKADAARRDPTNNYSELVASHVYPEIINKVRQYTGQDPRRIQPQQLMMMAGQAMQSVVQAEARHRPELERAAIEIVLSLPEFQGAREAYEADELKIEAHLLEPDAMMQQMQQRIRGAAEEEPEEGAEAPERPERQMQVEPGEDSDEDREQLGLDVPQIRGEYNAEAEKRKMINLLIQGAAVNKNYAYHQIADRLRQIDPNILNNYGKIMSIGELMYWAAPEDMLNQMMGSGQGGGGMEEVTYEPLNPDLTPPSAGGEEGGEEGGDQGPIEVGGEQAHQPSGVWTIRASAMVFPVLIQELTKGLYEFLSHNEDDPDDVRKYAYNKGDTLGNEQWDIMQGPGVWRHLNQLVNQANAGDLMSKIYRHLVTLPTGEFNRTMQEILKETPAGRQFIQRIVAEIRADEQGTREESLAYRTIKAL